MTVNRQCSSGLQAVANVASNIKAGLYDIGMIRWWLILRSPFCEEKFEKKIHGELTFVIYSRYCCWPRVHDSEPSSP
jgi:hypothetical protein